MKSNQTNNDNLPNIVNKNKTETPSENLHYLYPNGHRITHQMRWFKGSRNRGLKSDVA